MARDFDGSTQYLILTSAILQAVPITMCCWFNADDITNMQRLITIGYNADPGNGKRGEFSLALRGDLTGDPVSALVTNSAGTWADAWSTTGYTAGAWFHACAVFATNALRSAYINGGSKASNTTDQSAGPPQPYQDRTSIGCRPFATPTTFLNGRAAEAAIWNIALTDAEVAVLATGVSPALVHPQNLVFYPPLIGRCSPEIDIVGGHGLTLVGAPPVADHPRVFYMHGGLKLGRPGTAATAKLLMLQANKRGNVGMTAGGKQ